MGPESVRRGRLTRSCPGPTERQGAEPLPRTLRNPSEDRRPTLSWPRSIPIDGEPADVVAVVTITVSGLRKAMCRSCSSTATPALVQGRVRDFVRSWPNQTESPFPEGISSRRTAQMRSARQWRSWCCEGAQTAGRSLQGRASKTRLNGVSAARRNRVKPPSFTITFVSRCSPACAPSAGPCCASETGTQMSDDAP